MNTPPAPVQGLLLFAHGARDPRWALPFQAVAERVRRARPGWAVELGFLEFMTPDLRTAGTTLVASGCAAVDVVPLFLGAGGHVRKDLPALLEELGAAYPGVAWRLQAAIGEVESVIDAMAEAAVACVPANVNVDLDVDHVHGHAQPAAPAHARRTPAE